MNSRFVKNMLSLFNSQIENFAFYLAQEHSEITKDDVLIAWCDMQNQPYSIFGIKREKLSDAESSCELEDPPSDNEEEKILIEKVATVEEPKENANENCIVECTFDDSDFEKDEDAKIIVKRRCAKKSKSKSRSIISDDEANDSDDEDCKISEVIEKPKTSAKKTSVKKPEKKIAKKTTSSKRSPSKNSTQCTYVFTRGANVGSQCPIMAKTGNRCSKHKKQETTQ